MVRVDCSAISRCAGALMRAAGGPLDGLAGEAARLLAETAAGHTPVDTGRLRAGWIAEPGEGLRAGVTNDVEYASFVEYGHRTRGGRGFVAGRFMLRQAIGETEEALSGLVEARLEEIVGGAFLD